MALVNFKNEISIYGLGTLVSRALPFLLIPIYTRLFSVEEYGQLDLLMTLAMLAGGLMNGGLNSANSFYFFKNEKEGVKQQAGIISATFGTRLFWSTGILGLIFLTISILNYTPYQFSLPLLLMVVVFSGSYVNQFMMQAIEIFRITHKPIKYVATVSLYKISSDLFSLLAIVLGGFGLYGYFGGIFIAGILALAISIFFIRDYLREEWFNFSKSRPLLKFGLYLVPETISSWVLSVSDRWFIVFFLGLNFVGQYSLGVKISLIITMIVQSFRLAWWPIALKMMHKPEGIPLFQKMSVIFLGLGGGVTLLMGGYAKPLISLIAPTGYEMAHRYVGLLTFAAIGYGFIQFSKIGIYKSEKMVNMVYLSVFAVCANILFNFLFIPVLGALGAALGTTCAVILKNGVALLISERLWKIKFPYFVLTTQVLLVSIGLYLLERYHYQLSIVVVVTGLAIILILHAVWKLLDNNFKKDLQYLS